ncbi:MAG TPA: PP0621 family protein [Candidatus Binatia bacterium]|nr:PP0621 family protein [Candidatus Binatia bacterium]
MLLRILFFFLLFYLFYRIYFSGRRSARRAARPRDVGAAEEMVLDPQCRSYLPKSEAMLRGDQYFCSEHCASLYLVGRAS